MTDKTDRTDKTGAPRSNTAITLTKEIEHGM
jgi:hypothetical protein